jgi:hypothetical protein
MYARKQRSQICVLCGQNSYPYSVVCVRTLYILYTWSSSNPHPEVTQEKGRLSNSKKKWCFNKMRYRTYLEIQEIDRPGQPCCDESIFPRYNLLILLNVKKSAKKSCKIMVALLNLFHKDVLIVSCLALICSEKWNEGNQEEGRHYFFERDACKKTGGWESCLLMPSKNLSFNYLLFKSLMITYDPDFCD